MEKQGDLFVVGTGTGVGKTVLSLLLMQFFYRQGLRPFYLKPVQTGCRDPYDSDSDARFVYRNVLPLQAQDPARSVTYCFRAPKAPWFAARHEGKTVDIRQIEAALDARRQDADVFIVEAAGGVLVPLNAHQLVIDLTIHLNFTPLLAAGAGLGTINHTLLSIEALCARGIKPAGVILMNAAGHESDEAMIAENIEAIEAFSDCPVVGVIGGIQNFSDPPSECYLPLERLWGTNLAEKA